MNLQKNIHIQKYVHLYNIDTLTFLSITKVNTVKKISFKVVVTVQKLNCSCKICKVTGNLRRSTKTFIMEEIWFAKRSLLCSITCCMVHCCPTYIFLTVYMQNNSFDQFSVKITHIQNRVATACLRISTNLSYGTILG